MNGLATLLAPAGDALEVTGMAGRPPGTAEKATGADGFLGILQQMIAGSAQVASLMSMLPSLPVLALQGSASDGGNATPQEDPAGQLISAVGERSGVTEQQGTPALLSLSSQGTSPPLLLEADVPAPSLSVSLPVVEEQLLPADQAEQVTARSPAPKPMDSSTSRSGGFALPIADLLSADDTDLSIVKTWLEKTGEASSASKAPVSAEDGEIVRVSGKKGQAASNPGLQATRNTGSFVKLAFAPLLRSSRQSQTDSPAVEHPRRENAGQLSTGRESVQEDRTVRVSPSFAGSIVSLDQKAEGKDREVVTAEPMPVKAVGVEEKTPVQSKAGETPVASEEMPAKAVVTAKPVMESASRETDASKNSLPHLQTQVTPVRSSVTRLDPGTTRFTEVPMPMSTETARSVVDQVVKEAALQVRGEASEMRITLVPASLGEVKLSVRMEGGQMQAQIDVSHAAVKAALEVNLGQLRDALSSHGIEVQRLDVYHNGQSLAGDTRGNQGDRPRRQGGRHHSYATEAVDQLVTGRMMGYNTMEVVM